MTTIFISYSRDDSATAYNLKRALKHKGFTVLIDEDFINAGGDIKQVIIENIRKSDVFLALISKNSLMSPWVTLEIVTAHYNEALQRDKRFIACYLDDEFLQHDFQAKANEQIDAKIKKLTEEIKKNLEDELGLLIEERERLQNHRNSLGMILRKLRGSLTLDMRGAEFERSLERIVKGMGDTPRRISSEPRRIDVAVPSDSVIGQIIDLLVQVRFLDSPPLSINNWPLRRRPHSLEIGGEIVELAFPVNPKTGEMEAARLRVVIIAPDFEIKGENEKVLEVKSGKISPSLIFLLSAKRQGDLRINVEIYNETRACVGTVPIETFVGTIQREVGVNLASFSFVITSAPYAKSAYVQSAAQKEGRWASDKSLPHSVSPSSEIPATKVSTKPSSGAKWKVGFISTSLIIFIIVFGIYLRLSLHRIDNPTPLPASLPSPSPTPTPAPVEADDIATLYVPSNYMGAGAKGLVQVDRSFTENPHSAPTCDKWTVRFNEQKRWAAVAWAYPENNWGDQEGRNLSAYERITLWVRGTRGQRLSFKTGGNTKPKATYPSTLPEYTKIVELTGEWQQVIIPLENNRKSNVPIALVWAAEAAGRGTQEMTFYLDDIRLEKTSKP